MDRRTVRELYFEFKARGIGHIVGEYAKCCLWAARAVHEFNRLQWDDKVRLRVEFDDDCDTSWMDDNQRAQWNGEAYGTIGEYWDETSQSWEFADSCWGHIGYQNPGDPFENDYVIDHMREAVDRYRSQLITII